jgi:hypothetical protein
VERLVGREDWGRLEEVAILVGGAEADGVDVRLDIVPVSAGLALSHGVAEVARKVMFAGVSDMV